jgi:hypothetical protein
VLLIVVFASEPLSAPSARLQGSNRIVAGPVSAERREPTPSGPDHAPKVKDRASSPAAGSSSLPAVADKRPTVSVTDYGADGRDKADDTEAIQRANDEIESRGGGTVLFPRGTFRAAGIEQGSRVEFRGQRGSVIEHPTGGPVPMISAKRRQTQGRIEARSRALFVSDRSLPIERGLVAIEGAGGASPYQFTELASGISASAGSMPIRDARGFPSNRSSDPNLLIVGNEILSYQWITGGQLLGVQRGLLGTRAAAHRSGTSVSQALAFIARVSSIAKDRIVLDRPAPVAVRDAPVYLGPIGLKISGLTLDGHRSAGGQGTGTHAVRYDLVRFASITNTTIRNVDDGAIAFMRATQDSVIADNRLVDAGSPASHLGSGVWLTHGSKNNIVSGNVIEGDAFGGVYIDDRTVSSTQFDGACSGNVIEGNTINLNETGTNAGIAVLGSPDNVIRDNDVRGSFGGIRLFTGGQGTEPVPTSNNLVENNRLENHSVGLWLEASDNRILDNTQHNVDRPIVDRGSGNTID